MSESQNVDVTGDAIAKCVLDKFNSLPKKRKPLQQGNVREWVPLAGVVAERKGPRDGGHLRFYLSDFEPTIECCNSHLLSNSTKWHTPLYLPWHRHEMPPPRLSPHRRWLHPPRLARRDPRPPLLQPLYPRRAHLHDLLRLALESQIRHPPLPPTS